MSSLFERVLSIVFLETLTGLYAIFKVLNLLYKGDSCLMTA